MSTPKFYKPPKDSTGKQLWVPIVVKNKDVLMGFILGINLADSIYSIDREALFASLSSAKYNDITKSGKRLRDMTNKEFREYAESIVQDGTDRVEALNSKDGNNCDLEDYVLTLSCSCGNFISYKNNESIPDKDTYCDMCSNKIIHYTKSDKVFIYDGLTGRNNEAIFSILNSLVEAEPTEPEETSW